MCTLLLLFLNPRKKGWEKLRKIQRSLKWKTSPGGPQRENSRARCSNTVLNR